MILSKLMTAKRREAIAAPEMRAREMMRSSEEVLVTVAGDTLLGNEYANGMAGVGDALWALKTERKDEGAGGTKETCWRRVQTRWTRRALCAILGAHVPAVAASIMGA